MYLTYLLHYEKSKHERYYLQCYMNIYSEMYSSRDVSYSLTTAKFKPYVFLVLGFTLPIVAKICILRLCVISAHYIHRYLQIADWCTPWEVASSENVVFVDAAFSKDRGLPQPRGRVGHLKRKPKYKSL
jgi:hypothetical protein